MVFDSLDPISEEQPDPIPCLDTQRGPLLTAPPLLAPILVTTAQDLEAMIAALTGQSAIAVDVEADSFYVYYEKTCLIQISTPERDYIIDPLAVPELLPLRSILDNPAIEKVFHAAEYDLLCLKRDFDFQVVNLFDTLIASKVLGWSQRGLAALVGDLFAVELDKQMQKTNWGHRPLTPRMIAYAQQDTHYLLPLRDYMGRELVKTGRWGEAQEDFVRISHVHWQSREFDPEDYQRLKGADTLDGYGLSVLRELYIWRDQEARSRNRPPFRVIADSTLLTLSLVRPATLAELASVRGMTPLLVRRYGAKILSAINRGLQNGPRRLSRPQPSPNHLTGAAQARYEKIRQWRKEKADARGVEPDVILPKEALYALARRPPANPEELTRVPDLGPWRVENYGPELIHLLHQVK